MVKCQTTSNLISVHDRKITYYQKNFPERKHAVKSHKHAKPVKCKNNEKCHGKCLVFTAGNILSCVILTI